MRISPDVDIYLSDNCAKREMDHGRLTKVTCLFVCIVMQKEHYVDTLE